MSTARVAIRSLLSSTLLLAACGNNPATYGGQPDSSTSAGQDAGGTTGGDMPDGSLEVVPDMDAGTTPRPDAGHPATVDAGHPVTDGGYLAGLPCDVAGLLKNNCLSCHSKPPAGGAPMPITNYDDLQKPTPTDASKTVAQQSLARMQDPNSPMPPGSPLPDSEIAILRNWINAGEPVGTCNSSTPDAGTPVTTPDAGMSSGGVDGVPNSPPTCTSGITWILGDLGTDLMHPGRACIDCHTSKHEGPSLTIAGTVYPTTHEPDDCDGSKGSGITVEITDAAGNVIDLTPNGVGTFRSSNSITPPYHAKVMSGGRVREMLQAQTSGDCNSCHTQNGTNGAPGRIVAP